MELLRELVADCGSEHGEHPLVLGDALALRLGGNQGRHIAGDAQGFDGGLLFGHGRDDSTGTVSGVIVSALSTNGTGEVAPSRPPAKELEVPVQVEANSFAPDSVYAEFTTEERLIFDRQEDEANHRHATMLAVRDEHANHTVHGLADDSLRRLRKAYQRDLEDIADGDLSDSKSGSRSRMLKAKIADIEAEQEWRAALVETWQASSDGTHSVTGYAARGGLQAVVENGATPPSYDLAVRLDWRNWKEDRPHVLDWGATDAS